MAIEDLNTLRLGPDAWNIGGPSDRLRPHIQPGQYGPGGKDFTNKSSELRPPFRDVMAVFWKTKGDMSWPICTLEIEPDHTTIHALYTVSADSVRVISWTGEEAGLYFEQYAHVQVMSGMVININAPHQSSIGFSLPHWIRSQREDPPMKVWASYLSRRLTIMEDV